MTQAHDCLSLSNDPTAYLPSLKRILRIIGGGNVVLQFADGSRLKYIYTDSWRTDRLEVTNDDLCMQRV